jgi:hypothetical protein
MTLGDTGQQDLAACHKLFWWCQRSRMWFLKSTSKPLFSAIRFPISMCNCYATRTTRCQGITSDRQGWSVFPTPSDTSNLKDCNYSKKVNLFIL